MRGAFTEGIFPIIIFGQTTPCAETSVTQSIRGRIVKEYVEGRCYPLFSREEMMVKYFMRHGNIVGTELETIGKPHLPKRGLELPSDAGRSMPEELELRRST
jgi:hypothetical protein